MTRNKNWSRKLKKFLVCSKCSSWSHKSEVCFYKQNCSKCNEIHISNLWNIKRFFACSLSCNKGSCLMSLQNIPIKNSSSKAWVMFDNGSKITLVSSFFPKQNKLPFKEATYTLAGVRSKATTYNLG